MGTMRRALLFAFPLLVVPLVPLLGCSSDSDTGTPPQDSGTPDVSGDSGDSGDAAVAPTFKSTVDKTYDTKIPRLAYDEAKKLGNGPAKDPAVRDKLMTDGYGDIVEKPGEKHAPRYYGTDRPTANPSAPLLTRFIHMPDLQLADEETPSRLGGLDQPGDLLNASARPQDGELCVLLNQAVHTANGIHKQAALDFLLLGGDNVDSAQSNELDWVMNILDGAKGVKCDSGDVDDPVAGPANDGKDAFDAEGLQMKWLWVTGNHDVLVNGNEPLDENKDGVLDDTMLKRVMGTTADTGTRDYRATFGKGGIWTGPVIADAKRTPLLRKDVMKRVYDRTGGPGPDHHGLAADATTTGKAIYAYDVGTKLRMVVWDSPAETGSADGIIRRPDMEGPIKTLLDKAKTDGKWVFVVSHHAIDKITDGGGPFGVKQPDAVPADEFKDFLAGYTNVIGSIVGHSHVNRVEFIPGKTRGFWEIMTSAVADWPQQLRVFEVFDEGSWVRIRLTSVDIDFEGASAAAKRGRAFTALDWSSGWGGGGGGRPEDRNVELWIKP